jgi:hypothetical protein
MAMTNPWDRQYQSVWLERSADTSLDNWLRLFALALGRHRANGHANFAPGEIAQCLGKVGPNNEFRPLSNSSVSNAIRLAKDRGWITTESNARCIVMPPHAVAGGDGNPHEVCRTCRVRNKARRHGLRSA